MPELFPESLKLKPKRPISNDANANITDTDTNSNDAVANIARAFFNACASGDANFAGAYGGASNGIAYRVANKAGAYGGAKFDESLDESAKAHVLTPNGVKQVRD